MTPQGCIWWAVIGSCALFLPGIPVLGQVAPEPQAEWMPPETGAPPEVSLFRETADSLALLLIDLEIREAEAGLEQHAFWRRLIPDLRFSASASLQQDIFLDPVAGSTFVLPRAGVRLTITLPLNRILDDDQYDRAAFRLEHLRIRRGMHEKRLAEGATLRGRHENELLRQLTARREELALVEDLLRYQELMFEEDKTGFETLIGTRIRLIRLRHTLETLNHELGILNGYERKKDQN